MSMILVLSITVIAYYFIIFGKNIKKSIITLFLGTLLFVLHPVKGLNLENMGEIVSFETLGILLGMMIIVEILKESGAFTFTAVSAIKISRYKFWPVMFLLMIIVILFSAFLDNLVTIMIIAPIIFLVADTLEINPTPLILLSIYVDNIGGMSTLIGSPLNIVLGSVGKLDFTEFLIKMLPLTVITFITTMLIYKFNNKVDTKEYNKKLEKLKKMDASKTIQNKSEMIKGIIVFSIVLAGFMLHNTIKIDIALIAMTGALVLMILTKKGFEEMATVIDWDTMFFYGGLFAIAFSLEKVGVSKAIASMFMPLISQKILLLFAMLFAGAISIPFLSAVPGTLIFAPVIKILIDNGAPFDLWYAYAIGANLGTNLTPLGAVQNIVGASLIFKQTGKEVPFGEYMRKALPTTLITTLIGALYLVVISYI